MPSPSAFWQFYKADPTGFSLLGRLLVALMGTYTLIVILRLGRWAYGKTTGLFALVFLAVTFLHIRDSHFITVDIPLTLFCTLAVLGSLLGCCKNLSYFWWAALSVGLATGTKYTGVLTLFPLWMALSLSPGLAPFKKIKKAIQLTLFSFIVFLLTTPYAFLDFSSFWRDLRYQFFTTQHSEPIYGGGGIPWLVYWMEELRWGLGLPLEILVLAGLAYAIYKRHRSDRILLAWILPYYLFIGLWSRHWGRWILPIVPVLVLLGARFWVEEVISHLKNRKGSQWLLPLCMVLLVFIPLYSSIRCDYLLSSRIDTRTKAYLALSNEEDLLNSPIFYTAFSVPIDRMDSFRATRLKYPPILENRILKDRPAFRQGESHQPVSRSLGEIQWDAIKQGQRVRLFIISSFYRNVAYDPRIMAAYPSLETYRQFYRDVESQTKILAWISPSKEGQFIPFHPENIYAPTVFLPRFERPGPALEIRWLPDDSF